MAKKNIYTIGGTVQAGGGIYIKRKADDELLELCRQGEPAFILSSRQVGKSSLMTRTAEQLGQENIRSSIIDLSSLGTQVTPDEWYLGILNIIATDLNLETDIFAWWAQFEGLGPAQRFFNFLRDVVLKEIQQCVVLFFDEIDTTLSLVFADDFFTTLRAMYNARSNTPDFRRLSFVLVGVATPGDLISDSKRTPFNIGRRVEINDFTLAEALPLADGLGEQAVQVLTWVFQYTHGHPYLTQRLCAYLAASQESISEQTVDDAVERLFTGEQGKQDNNLQFVRDMLSKRSPDVTKVLLIYGDVRSGKIVLDDERSIAKAHLKLSGLVRSELGVLRVRNQIYNTVFNTRWVQENTPKNWQRVALIVITTLLGVLILSTLGILINDFLVGARVNDNIANFISTTSTTDRLSDLAAIYSEKGILQNTNSSIQAAQLFYSLTADEQTSMFHDGEFDQDPDLQNDLVTVIRNLYVTVADVDPDEDNTGLLTTMYTSLEGMENISIAVSLRDEINSWLEARENVRSGNYLGALSDYNVAIAHNPGNQATLFERAKVHVALEDSTEALNDLDAAILAAKQSAPEQAEVFTPVPQTESPTPGSVTPGATRTITPEAASTSAGLTPASTLPAISPEDLTPTPDCTCQLPSSVLEEGYESNFTTLIDVINAVRALIGTSPDLQVAIDSDGQSGYPNLLSYGLIKEISPTEAIFTQSAALTAAAVPTDTPPTGERNSTSEPDTSTALPIPIVTRIPVGVDWSVNCISELWIPYPSNITTTTDPTGCLVQPVNSFFTTAGSLALIVEEQASSAQMYGMFTKLPSDGTVRVELLPQAVTRAEIIMGVFASPDIDSDGVIIAFTEDGKFFMKTMPGQGRFAESIDLSAKDPFYDALFDFNSDIVTVMVVKDQVELGTVSVVSEEKWLFLGYHVLNGNNFIEAEFSNLVITER